MSNAQLSSQLHILKMRGPISEYIARMIKHSPIQDGAELVEGLKFESPLNRRTAPSPFRYKIDNGDFVIMLPERFAVTRKLMGVLCMLGGVHSDFMNDPKKLDGLVCGIASLLVCTSKMGCMSWNLPAGPPQLLGACPGAIVGWQTGDEGIDNKPRKPQKVEPLSKGQLVFAEKFKVPYVTSTWRRCNYVSIDGMNLDNRVANPPAGWRPVVKDLRFPSGLLQDNLDRLASAYGQEMAVDTAKYICNGCYALKNAYGNSANIFLMELRRQWTLWCLKHNPKEFQQAISLAIEHEGRRNFKARSSNAPDPEPGTGKTHVNEFPDPSYFRIHDSGDFFLAGKSENAYFNAWMDIVRHFGKPREWAPNGIHFWAPTRLWCDPKQLDVLDSYIARHGMPKNMSLKPSAMHFGDDAPEVEGLAAGAGAYKSHGKAGWECPAYRSIAERGGAVQLWEDWKAPKGKPLEPEKVALQKCLGDQPQPKVFPAKPVPGKKDEPLMKDGHPVKASPEEIRACKFVAVPAFEKSGSCQYAEDDKGRPGCRVCWEGKVPVLYREH